MSTLVPFFTTKPANDDANIQGAVLRVVESQWYVLGEEVKKFEGEFSRYCGVDHCVALASGTDALELALKAIGVCAGDEVVLVANAGFYGSTALRLIGAAPYYVDVESDTLSVCVEAVRAAIKRRPRALLITHLYGRLADIEKIVQLAEAADIPVIEDCAQAHGAEVSGKKAGSFGAVGCFSFYPTKNLGALGDGGAIICRDKNIASQVRKLRQYGWTEKYQVDISAGRNSRLDEIQAAVLREKLPYLDAHNRQRQSISRRYNSAFRSLPITCPPDFDHEFVAHLYVIQSDRRDELKSYLESNGVRSEIHFPRPDHLQGAYACEQSNGDLPVTETVCDNVLSLPCFPGMGDSQVTIVITLVNRFFLGEGE